MTGIPTDLDLQALLAEEQFVRRLARGLLFDEHRVDDVVQQTWLQALRTPPRPGASLRGWLSRVVRGLASNERRGAARRRRRESAAAIPEALPSVDQVLARESLRQQVLQALVGLPEPYRTAVLLRYFEDMAPKAIADRLGIPAATARSRLKRGLDLMRERLDRAHGDRKAWCMGLLPLVRPGRVAAGASAGVAGWIGGLFVMKKLAIAVGLLLGLLAVAVWWSGSLDAPPQPETTAAAHSSRASSAAADPDREPAPVANRRAAGAGTGPAAAPDYGAALAGFRGRLLRPDGLAAAGERVRIAGIDGLSLYSEGPDLGVGGAAGGVRAGLRLMHEEAVSGEDGVFVVRGLWPRATYVLQAGIGGGHALFRPLARTPGPGEIVDLGDLVLPAAATIVGRVVDAEGRPAAGVEVWAADVPGVLLSAVPLDRVEPRAGAMVLLPDPTAAELGGDGDYAARLRWFLGSDLFREPLDPAEDGLSLRVFDAPEWVSRVWDLLPVARTRTGEDGAFELRGVTPGGNLLVAHRTGAASAIRQRVLARAGETRDAGTLALGAGQELRGRVVDARGDAVAGAQVRVAALGVLGFFGMAFAEPQVETDAEGLFRVPGLPRGRVLVAARRSPRHPWTSIGPLAADEVERIRLPAAAELDVVVRSRAGAPLTGAELRLLDGPMLGELTRAGLQRPLPLQGRMQGGPDGTWRITDLAAGVYTLEVVAAGHAPEAIMVALPRNGPIEVSLSPAAPFSVLVTDEGGAPVAGAKVYVQRAGTPLWARSVMPTSYGLPAWESLPHLAGYTGADGRLMVEHLPPGRAFVSVLHPAFGQAGMVVQLPVETARLVLPPPAALSGVLTEQGAPADPEKWRLVLIRRGEDLPTGMPWPIGQAVPARDGSYRVAGLAPGLYRIDVQPSLAEVRSLGTFVGFLRRQIFGLAFFDRQRSREVVLDAGAERRLDFDLDPSRDPATAGGSLRGVVTLDGAPVPGLQIYQVDGWTTRVAGTVTGDGSFHLDGLPEGETTLQVRDPAGEDVYWQGEVVLGPQKAVHLDLRLLTGSLAGVARFADGRPGGEIELRIQGELAGPGGGESFRQVVTGADGRFAVSRLPAGTYTVTASAAEAGGSRSEIQVLPGASQRVELELRPMGLLQGRVSAAARAAGITALVLTDAEKTFTYYLPLPDDGAFRIGSLTPGPYLLRLQDGDRRAYEAVPARVDLPRAGPPLVLELGPPVGR